MKEGGVEDGALRMIWARPAGGGEQVGGHLIFTLQPQEALWAFIRGGANVGLQLFVWKTIQQLINNNTRKKLIFCVLITIKLLSPHPVFFTRNAVSTSMQNLKYLGCVPEKELWKEGCAGMDSLGININIIVINFLHLTFLSLSFLICKMGILKPTS